MSLNCSAEPHHTKTTSCNACGVCKRCPNAQCHELRTHPKASQGGGVKSLYAQDYHAAADAAPQRGAPRETALVHSSLAEATLAAPLDEAIAAVEELNEPQHFLVDNLMRSIRESLGSSLTEHQRKRAEPYTLDQLQTSKSSRFDAVSMMSQLMHVGLTWATGDDAEAAAYLERKVWETTHFYAASENQTMLHEAARQFLVAHDELQARTHFAMLAKAFKFERREKFQLVLTDALTKAKDDAQLLASMKPLVIRTTPRAAAAIAAGSAEEETDSEDQQPPSATTTATTIPSTSKTVQVTLSSKQQLERKAAWLRSRTRMKQAQLDFAAISRNQALQPLHGKSRVTLDRIFKAMTIIEQLCLGWRGGQVRSVEVGGQTVDNVPILMSVVTMRAAYDAYVVKMAAEGAQALGYYTFALVYKALARTTEHKASLSYYYTDGLHAWELLNKMVTTAQTFLTMHHNVTNIEAAEEIAELGYTIEDLLAGLKSGLTTFKYELRTHLNPMACDRNPVHCCRFAVGAGCLNKHDKLDNCVTCLNFVQLARRVKLYIQAVRNTLSKEHEQEPNFKTEGNQSGRAVRELDTMWKVLGAASKELHHFHCHVARGVWQSNKTLAIVDSLRGDCVYLVIDHKMKVEPVYRNEATVDFYGKRGISILGAWIRFRLQGSGPLVGVYFDTVVTVANQSAAQVQSVLTSLIQTQIIPRMPWVKHVLICTDNGTAFSSEKNWKYVHGRNRTKWDCDVTVKRWTYFEAQCGKTALDTHFSYVGQVVRRYALETGKVTTPAEVFKALRHRDGLAGSACMLLEVDGLSEAPEDGGEASKKIIGTRITHDVHFTPSGVTLFDFIESRNRRELVLKNDAAMPPARFRVLDTHVSEGFQLAFASAVGAVTGSTTTTTTTTTSAASTATAPSLVFAPGQVASVSASAIAPVFGGTTTTTSAVSEASAPSLLPTLGQVTGGATPLHKNVARALVQFAQGRQNELKSAPVLGGIDTATAAPPAKKQKKSEKLKTLANWAPVFGVYWAKPEMRDTFTLSDAVTAKLKEMVRDNEAREVN